MSRSLRSCRDLSVTSTQVKIDFPRRKTRQSCVGQEKVVEECQKKDNNTTAFRSSTKKKQETKDRRKRLLSRSNDENSGESPAKSPRKDKVIGLKSPLLDRSNNQKMEPLLGITKRKLDLCSPAPKESSYTKIRQALHTSVPKTLVSRENELRCIRNFMKDCLVENEAGSLYMSGAPGTGKTACLTKVLEEFKEKTNKNLKSVFLNCMSLKMSQSIFSKVSEEIGTANVLSKNAVKHLENIFTSNGPKILLVLDEIDQLESKNQEILYKLFEMPFLPKSRLVLIGIANALDLTDRVLPRLQARSSCKPILLPFPPYSKDEISLILQERIKEFNSNAVDPTAITFCARKVSAMTGDARKALDILRRSVEIVESTCQKNRPALKLVSKTPESQSGKKITIAHVASVCAEVYGSKISSPGTNFTFPLQQKIVICTLMVCLKDKKIKEVTNSKLYEAYCRVCRSKQISYVSQEEFGGICRLLEAQGIMAVKVTKDIRNNKISLRLQESEIEHALQDKTLLSSILLNGIPSS